MRDIPIIFSGPMVRAFLENRKKMTRRLALASRKVKQESGPGFYRSQTKIVPSPWQRVQPGDRLWVRENLTCIGDGIWHYAADRAKLEVLRSDPRAAAMIAWAHHEERGNVPSIHMPRMFSRLTLIVTATKIERLQDISAADAMAEGVERVYPEGGYGVRAPLQHPATHDARNGWWHIVETPQDAFMWLWRKLHDDASWDANPEVVALTLQVHKSNIDSLPKQEAA